MNRIIIVLIILIIIFLVLIFSNRSENFTGLSELQQQDLERIYYLERVDTNEYDVDFLGPECLAKCIRQFGARLNYTNCEGYSNPIQWSEENPTRGYCYRANSLEFPFNCEGEECQLKCGKDGNKDQDNPDYSEYNPDKDFTNCELIGDSPNRMCVEKNLNMLRGGGCEITSSCKSCIEKYQPNIELMNSIVTKTIHDFEQSPCSN